MEENIDVDALGMTAADWGNAGEPPEVLAEPAPAVDTANSVDIDKYMAKFDAVLDLIDASTAAASDVSRPIDSSIGDHRTAAITAFVRIQATINEQIASLLVDMNNLIK